MEKIDYDLVCIQILKVTARKLMNGQTYQAEKVLESPLFYSFCESYNAEPGLVACGIKEMAGKGYIPVNLKRSLEYLG